MAETIDMQPLTLNVPALVTVTARLAQIMAEEVDFLEDMKISSIADLQPEKLRLTVLLDKQKHMIERHPELLANLTPEDKEKLHNVAKIFVSVLGENHKRLLLAKEVNLCVVKAIKEVVTDSSTNRYYSGSGEHEIWQPDSISVTLNKTV